MLVMLRWVVEDDDGTCRVAGKPTAMDCIEFANEILKNEDELAMTMNDSRTTLMLNVVRILVPNDPGKQPATTNATRDENNG